MKKIIIKKEIENLFTEMEKSEESARFYAGLQNSADDVEKHRTKAAELRKEIKAHDIISQLDKAIDEVEGRASVRTINAFDAISELRKYEKMLGISKKAMEGIAIRVNLNAQDFPRAYKYEPQATIFIAVYSNGTWRITDIGRDICGNKKIICTFMPDSAKEAIINQYTSM